MRHSPVFILSKVFLLEILREKWFYGAICVAVGLFLMNMVVGSLSFDEQERIVFHLSLSTILLVGLGICVILGISSISKEIEKQTCLLILARPVSRGQFLLAKAAALAAFLGIFDFTLGLFLGGLMRGNFPWENLFAIVFTTWLEHLVLLGLALCAGLSLGRAVAGLFTVGYFVLGHWLPDLAYFAKKSDNAAFALFNQLAQAVIPHLYEMDQRSVYFLKNGLPENQLFWAILHTGAWLVVLFLIGSQLWRRRNLV